MYYCNVFEQFLCWLWYQCLYIDITILSDWMVKMYARFSSSKQYGTVVRSAEGVSRAYLPVWAGCWGRLPITGILQWLQRWSWRAKRQGRVQVSREEKSTYLYMCVFWVSSTSCRKIYAWFIVCVSLLLVQGSRTRICSERSRRTTTLQPTTTVCCCYCCCAFKQNVYRTCDWVVMNFILVSAFMYVLALCINFTQCVQTSWPWSYNGWPSSCNGWWSWSCNGWASSCNGWSWSCHGWPWSCYGWPWSCNGWPRFCNWWPWSWCTPVSVQQRTSYNA